MNDLNISDELPFDTLDALDLTEGSDKEPKEIKIEDSTLIVSAGAAITPQVMLFYAQRGADMKSKIDQLGAEISQRQDKMRLLNELIAAINNLTDDKNGLDLSKNLDIVEKLRVLKELGVTIPEGKLKFSSTERDRLVENLHLHGDSWDKENKTQTQKMEICIKELDRVMMLLKECQKCENQGKRGATAGIKGG